MILIVETPTDLSVYFREVPNSVNVCFLDHSMCTVLKEFNAIESCKTQNVFSPRPPSIYETAKRYRSHIRQIFSLKNSHR